MRHILTSLLHYLQDEAFVPGPAAQRRQLPASPSEAGRAAEGRAVPETPAQDPPEPWITKPLAIIVLRDLK